MSLSVVPRRFSSRRGALATMSRSLTMALWKSDSCSCRAYHRLSSLSLSSAFDFAFITRPDGWLGSRVVSVLDSGAEGPGFKSQPRRCRVTVLGKLFTPIVPLFTKQQNW